MGEVKGLNLVEAPKNQNAIAVLEEALEAAKAGELMSVVIVGDCKGNMLYRVAGMTDRIALLGHLSNATFTVQNA